jgi:hypothetical protein
MTEFFSQVRTGEEGYFFFLLVFEEITISSQKNLHFLQFFNVFISPLEIFHSSITFNAISSQMRTKKDKRPCLKLGYSGNVSAGANQSSFRIWATLLPI